MSLIARFGRLRVVVVLTALVVLTSAIGTTLALTRPPLSSAEVAAVDRAGPGRERDAAALSAAEASTRLALTYRHDALGPGLRGATATMTGGFAHAFADSFRRDLVPAIRRTHATSRATVRGARLVRTHGDRAVVLVLVDQLRRDDLTGAAGTSTSWRLAVELSWTGPGDGSGDGSDGGADGEWRVDDVRPL